VGGPECPVPDRLLPCCEEGELPRGWGGGGRDRPEAACPPGCSPAAGGAGGFNAVQKLLTNPSSRQRDRDVMQFFGQHRPCDPGSKSRPGGSDGESSPGSPACTNRRPPIVGVSTVLGPRSLSGLVYPSLDRGTGTVVARARAINHQTCGLFLPKPREWSDPRVLSPRLVLIGSWRLPVNPSRCAAVVTQLVTHTPTGLSLAAV
jgi:hypothetical protein